MGEGRDVRTWERQTAGSRAMRPEKRRRHREGQRRRENAWNRDRGGGEGGRGRGQRPALGY